jgi:hypothetical protein
MTINPEHPCPRHYSWRTLTGAILTGAAAGVGITVTIYQTLGG